jgi:hypothetical protein
VAAEGGGRRRPKEGVAGRRRGSTAAGGGGSGALPRAGCNGEDWGKRRAEGVSNPRFGAREDGADLGFTEFLLRPLRRQGIWRRTCHVGFRGIPAERFGARELRRRHALLRRRS